jgi:hypothetical protein
MSKSRWLVTACAALALATTASFAGAASTTTLKATLSGTTEIPKGDPDGSGTATIKITGTKVCYTFTYSKIGTPNAAHIHEAAKGKAGPVVVPFFNKAHAKTGCVTTKSSEAKSLAKNPGSYYVNLHNAKYPGGALRGQLHK